MNPTPSRLARLGVWMQGDGDASRIPSRLFWTGLAVRVLYLTLAHTYKIPAADDHFKFGFEMGRIARALTTGDGYADPFEEHTGPTAWTPPVYPLLLAAVFKLFGVYTRASAWLILTLNSIFSAATAPAVWEMARRCFRARTGTPARGETVALWSGWLWALYPAAMQYAVHWVWDMALTAFLFSWVLILALRLRGVGEVDPEAARHQTARRWILCGTLWGLIALSNSSLLSFLPACGLWSAWSAWRRNLLLTARNVVLGGTCCFVIVAPWIARNERVFHKFIPLRGNLGAELYESALAVNQGFPWGAVIDGPGDPQFKRYKQLGELEFVRQQNERAHAIIAAHPRRFAGYTVKRMYMFWFGVPHPVEPGLKGFLVEAVRELDFSFLTVASMLGLALALRNRIPGAWLFLWAFLLFPVIYYVVTVQARFRHPLEPVMTVLIVYLFQSAERRGRGAGSQALIGRRAAEG